MRATALLTVAVLVVHQLRMAVEGGDAGGSAGSVMHDYLPGLAALAAVLAAIALTHFVAAVTQALTATSGGGVHGLRSASSRPRGFPRRAGSMAATVFAAHLVQQLAEGQAAGHPLTGLATGGLLVAAAGAVLAGAIVAALLGGADRALEILRSCVAPERRRRSPRFHGAPSSFPDLRRSAPLARHLAGRAPPAPA